MGGGGGGREEKSLGFQGEGGRGSVVTNIV